MLKRILVPVDFSDLAEVAARHASALARLFDATLILVNVYSPEIFKYTGGEGGYYVAQAIPTREEAVADATRLLQLLSSRVAAGMAVQHVVLEGDTAREIASFAQKNQVDLIVMPTRGYGPFRRFVLGSVTAKVLNDSDCPILTMTHEVAPPAEEPRPYRRVACAIDLGPHSENVVRWGSAFGAATGASLDVILAAPAVKVAGRDLGVSIRDMLLEAVKEEVAKLLDRAGAHAEVHVEIGDVAEYVPKAASSIGADLLVIGRTSKEGLLGRLRANTYSLIRESPCPVVSL